MGFSFESSYGSSKSGRRAFSCASVSADQPPPRADMRLTYALNLSPRSEIWARSFASASLWASLTEK